MALAAVEAVDAVEAEAEEAEAVEEAEVEREEEEREEERAEEMKSHGSCSPSQTRQWWLRRVRAPAALNRGPSSIAPAASTEQLAPVTPPKGITVPLMRRSATTSRTPARVAAGAAATRFTAFLLWRRCRR